MLHIGDKENDTKNVKLQEKENSKLSVGQLSQKPRRSVLKEFDPLALDSPNPKVKSVRSDEEEVFEDAESSITYSSCLNTTKICPKNNSNSSSSKSSNLLFPDAGEYSQTENKCLNKTPSESLNRTATDEPRGKNTMADKAPEQILNNFENQLGLTNINNCGIVEKTDLNNIISINNNEYEDNVEKQNSFSQVKDIKMTLNDSNGQTDNEELNTTVEFKEQNKSDEKNSEQHRESVKIDINKTEDCYTMAENRITQETDEPIIPININNKANELLKEANGIITEIVSESKPMEINLKQQGEISEGGLNKTIEFYETADNLIINESEQDTLGNNTSTSNTANLSKQVDDAVIGIVDNLEQQQTSKIELNTIEDSCITKNQIETIDLLEENKSKILEMVEKNNFIEENLKQDVPKIEDNQIIMENGQCSVPVKTIDEAAIGVVQVNTPIKDNLEQQQASKIELNKIEDSRITKNLNHTTEFLEEHLNKTFEMVKKNNFIEENLQQDVSKIEKNEITMENDDSTVPDKTIDEATIGIVQIHTPIKDNLEQQQASKVELNKIEDSCITTNLNDTTEFLEGNKNKTFEMVEKNNFIEENLKQDVSKIEKNEITMENDESTVPDKTIDEATIGIVQINTPIKDNLEQRQASKIGLNKIEDSCIIGNGNETTELLEDNKNKTFKMIEKNNFIEENLKQNISGVEENEFAVENGECTVLYKNIEKITEQIETVGPDTSDSKNEIAQEKMIAVSEEVRHELNQENVAIKRSGSPSMTSEINIKNEPSCKLIKKPSCRPSIRSVHNETRVIVKEELDGSKSSTTKQIKSSEEITHNKDHSASNNEQGKLLESLENQALKTEVHELQNEIQMIKGAIAMKEQLVANNIKVKELNHSQLVKKYKQVLHDYEKQIYQQAKDLETAKAACSQANRQFNNTEMAFADLFEKYQKCKIIIEQYKENEGLLITNLERAEEQLSKMEAKYTAMEEKCHEKIRKDKQMVQEEKQRNKLEITKLLAVLKRLEIKASSLETALKQKTLECQELSALCDDITGKSTDLC